MSPLIDVTNTEGQNCFLPDKIPKELVKKESAAKFQRRRNKSHLPDGLNGHSVEEGITGGSSSSSYGKTSDSQLEAIKMCNTRMRSSRPSGSESNNQGSLKHITLGHSVVDSMRVPPLPQITAAAADDVLSQAVQALSLNPLTAHTKPPSTRLNRHHKLTSKQSGRRKAKATASSNGLPENTDGTDVVRTPQQCGACGLEFTSLPVLTQHLAKHVYDGLYAAQWLTQAMTLVSSRQQLTNEAVVTTVHSVPNDGDRLQPQSTQPCPPSGSNH